MKRVNINDAEIEYMGPNAGGGNMQNYQNEPFIGILEEFYENGNLIGESECRNGYTYGLQTEYFENDQIKEEFMKSITVFIMHFEFDQDGKLISKIVGG